MFRTVPLSIIRSFSQYTQQWFMSYNFAESLQAKQGCIILQIGGNTDVCLVESLYKKLYCLKNLASSSINSLDNFYCLYIFTKKELPNFHVAYHQFF
jgi:hypothetical protein